MAETSTQKSFLSGRVAHFTESVIREMTRQAMLHGAVNLSQGFPDFPAPAEIKRAAQEAIAADVNQYAITWGARIFAKPSRAKWSYGKASRSIRSAKLRFAVAQLRP